MDKKRNKFKIMVIYCQRKTWLTFGNRGPSNFGPAFAF